MKVIELKQDMDAQFRAMQLQMDTRFAETHAKMDARFAEVDARFAAQPYRQLLPGHWRIQQVPCREVGNAAARFWASTAVATSQRGECE